jgi:hypothetical protein
LACYESKGLSQQERHQKFVRELKEHGGKWSVLDRVIDESGFGFSIFQSGISDEKGDESSLPAVCAQFARRCYALDPEPRYAGLDTTSSHCPSWAQFSGTEGIATETR